MEHPSARRSRNRVFDWRKALQIGGNRLGVVSRQMGEFRPGHDGEQLGAVRHLAFGDGCDNLLGRPVGQAGFLVRGQVAADENADAGDPNPTSEPARVRVRSGLPRRSPGV